MAVAPSAPAAPRTATPQHGNQKGGKGGKGSKGAGKFSSPLFDPSQQLKGPALNNAASQIANAQTQGPISELAAQIAQNNRQSAAGQKNAFGYYMQLGDLAKQAVQRDQQLGGNLNTNLSNIAAGTQSGLGQIGQNAQGGALARMNALGLDAGQTQALGNETARQQGIGQLNAQTFESAGTLQNQNFSQNASNNRGVDALAGTEAIKGIAQAGKFANEPLNSKIAALDASKGALKSTALGQLRTAERNYQIAQQGLGLKDKALNVTAAHDKATAANEQARIKLEGNAQQITKQNYLANQKLRAAANTIASTRAATAAGAAANKLHNPLTANESGTITNGISAARSILTHYAGMSPSQLDQLLTTGSLPGVKYTYTDPQTKQQKTRIITLHAPKIPGGNLGAIAQAAHDLNSQGYLSRKTINALNALGYRVGQTFPVTPAGSDAGKRVASTGGGLGATLGI